MRQRRRRKRGELTAALVAEAALALVDEEGADALTFRRLAEQLDAGTMTLYTYAPTREDLVRNVVSLMLSEVDARPVTGETWEATVRRVARSHRSMALRHSRAYVFIVNAPFDSSPMLDLSAAVLLLHEPQGLNQEARSAVLSVMSSFLIGFLWMETQALCRQEALEPRPFFRRPNQQSSVVPGPISGDAFERDLDVLVEGLRARVIAE